MQQDAANKAKFCKLNWTGVRWNRSKRGLILLPTRVFV
jgi:hypothetical protein